MVPEIQEGQGAGSGVKGCSKPQRNKNWDPHIGFLYSLQNWVGFRDHPLQIQRTRLRVFFNSLLRWGWWSLIQNSKSRSCETSWWLNQPIWKICSPNWIISPRFGVKIKNVWNHLGKYHWTKVTIVKFEPLAKHDRNAMVFLGGLSSRRTHFPPSRMENLNLGEISHDDRNRIVKPTITNHSSLILQWGTKPLKTRQHFVPENRPFNIV